jgi:hypothetical protein
MRFPLVILLVGLTLCASSPACATWPNDPTVNVPVCTVGSYLQYVQGIAPDGAGGAIILWQDTRSTYSLYAQRISSKGVAMWGTNGALVAATPAGIGSAVLVADGASGAFAAWVDYSDGVTARIRVQRFSSSGPVWTAGGVLADNDLVDSKAPALVPDGTGGVIAIWGVKGNSYTDPSLRAQHFSSTGVPQWTGGVWVCNTGGGQYYPVATTDGAGGAIAGWMDYASYSTAPDARAQRISAAGTRAWSDYGVSLCSLANSQYPGAIVADGAGGAIVAWSDSRSGNTDVYAQRISSAGAVQWTTGGVAVCAAAGNQAHMAMVRSGSDGSILTWEDGRATTTSTIYAQRLTDAGTCAWTANGLPLGSAAVMLNTGPSAVSDGAGGAIVAWEDKRDSATTSTDVYAQRISSGGSLAWAAAGVPVSRATNLQRYPIATADTSGGAIVAWTDYRNASYDPDIYCQRADRWGCLNPQPAVTAVVDWPADEGGFVNITFTASPEDGGGHGYVTEYRIWRQHGTDPWFLFGTQTATGAASYTVAADAVGSPGTVNAYTVEAHAPSGYSWSSEMAWGAAYDNLAPPAPTSFAGSYSGGTTTMGWAPCPASDFNAFKLYRGTTSGFVIGAESLITTTAGTSFVDAAGAPCWYKLTAVDIHGNEGTATALQPAGTADAGATSPRELALSAPAPNPLRGACAMQLALPRAARVTLAVHDAQGRRVRTLVADALPAGEHPVTWDGHDDGGHRVADGIYLVRLACEGRVITRRIAALR